MIRPSRVLGVWTVVGSVAVVAAAHADLDDFARERASVRRLVAANALSRRHGRYAHARERFVDGPDSIDRRATAWKEDAARWLADWLETLAVAEFAAEAADLEARLSERLDSASTRLRDLTMRADALARDCDAATSLLALGQREVYAGLEGEGSVVAALGQREAELKEAVSETSRGVVAAHARLHHLDAHSRRAILARVRRALLAQAAAPLDTILAGVEAMLQAQRMAGPLISDLRHWEHAANVHALNLQGFLLADAVEKSRGLCARARTELAQLPPSAHAAAASNRIDALCRAISRHGTTLTDVGLAPPEWVSEQLAVHRPEIQRRCAGSSANPACEKLAVLASISGERLRALSEAELRFVEVELSEGLAVVRATGGPS
jgi:hypothetical protein